MNNFKLKKVILSIFLICSFVMLHGQIKLLDESTTKESFSIVNDNSVATIHYDESDAEVVHTAAELLGGDIHRITGKKPNVVSEKFSQGAVIIIGTIGSSELIDNLIKKGKLDVNTIQGKWERYQIEMLRDPAPGINKALVIAGSDRRGTAYGVFYLAEVLGVSPWYWWADVPVIQRKQLKLNITPFVSESPSVKYRGIFLNDEDWGLKPWASKNMDPDINDIGPNTYDKVCELLLRLKANMLAPAMHEVTGAFYKYGENKKVADKYGIMITTSHAEPLLYNNTTEWDHERNGKWDYVKNKDGVLKVMDDRVKEASPYENIYTMGMRGIHDRAMSEVPEGYTKAKVLEEVIKGERDILTKYIEKDIEQIPQIFVPYKEVMDIYKSGMSLPEDITIVWPDDNYGYIKKLNNTEEAQREGGAGVYYHISYLGFPNDYLWLNTTPPALIYEEMYKAYKNGADKYWLLNVGDIKPGELGMQFFLDLAWDVSAINYETLPNYNANFLASIFGDQYFKEFKKIYNTYFHLGFERKPEYMGWDWKWNSMFAKENIVNTEFSFNHYDEANKRLENYSHIANQVKKIYDEIDDDYKSAFFQLVYYPVVGASLENHKMLLAQKNRNYALQHRSITNKLADRVVQIDDSITSITEYYNTMENGKWEGMMTAPERLPERQLPPLEKIEYSHTGLDLFIPGSESDFPVLPYFNRYTRKQHSFEIFNRGKVAEKWNAIPSKSWIVLNKYKGKTKYEERIEVSINWEDVPKKEKFKENIIINSTHLNDTIHLVVDNTEVSSKGALYMDDNGVVSILPSRFSRKFEDEKSKVQIISELGYEGQSLQLGQTENRNRSEVRIEYDFYTPTSGYVTVYSYALPTFTVNEQTGSQYGIQIDGSKLYWEETASDEYSFEWQENVIRNSVINTSKILIDKPGVHTLKLIGGDPGVVIQKLIIDTGGLKSSYLGPPATIILKKE